MRTDIVIGNILLYGLTLHFLLTVICTEQVYLWPNNPQNLCAFTVYCIIYNHLHLFIIRAPLSRPLVRLLCSVEGKMLVLENSIDAYYYSLHFS